MGEVIIEEIVRREYGPQQIREVFSEETDEFNNLCLSPLLGSIYEFLSRDFSKNSQSLGITYWRHRPNQHSIYPWFEIVVDGKIVDFEVHSIDIDEMDDDEMIWSIGGLAFSGPAAPVEKLFSAVKSFVAGYNFYALRAAAAGRLKKVKVYHLGYPTRRFYGV